MRTACLIASISLAAACGGSNAATQGSGGGSELAAPQWFQNRPKSSSSLFFVGDSAGASDEGSARDLAIQKALSELTNYCGATVKSTFNSLDREANGKSEQVVSLQVDVAGDEITVREAVVRQTVVGKDSSGLFAGYALVEWPRVQYEAVLAAQRERGKHALALFLKAEAAANENDSVAAREAWKEAKTTLGPQKSQVPLDHPTYKNTGLLWDAIVALGERLEASSKEKRGVFAVAVECVREGKPTSCNASRAGTLRQALAKTGKKVASEAVPSTVASSILSSENPTLDRSVRNAGYVIAIRYTADLQAVDGPFTFVRYGARGVVFDTASNRIVNVQEISPEKEGHPSFEGAMEKGWTTAEKKLVKWIEEQVPQIK